MRAAVVGFPCIGNGAASSGTPAELDMPAKHQGAEAWDELLQTRRSLVERLHHAEGPANWQTLFDDYWQLIFIAAESCGLAAGEAQEVVQQTIVEAALSVETSRFNPAICSFKSWLRQITRRHVASRLRGRHNSTIETASLDPSNGDTEFLLASAAQDRPFETVWEEAWQRNLEYVARERLKQHVSPKDYQIYILRSVKRKRPREVAQLTHTSVARVYLTHHRLAGLVKKELSTLRLQQQ